MLATLIVIGFAVILWSLLRLDQRVRAVGLELLKMKGRTTESDRRLSKRLYELSYLLRDINARLYDVHWAIVPFETQFKNNSDAAELRSVLRADRKDALDPVSDPDEVLPSDVDPTESIDTRDWREVGRLTVKDFDT